MPTTVMVDTGTAGAKHFLHFKRTVIDQVKTRVLAYINIVDGGMLGDFEQDVRTMDPELAASVVLAYPEQCVGIKTAHYWTREPFDREGSARRVVFRGSVKPDASIPVTPAFVRLTAV